MRESRRPHSPHRDPLKTTKAPPAPASSHLRLTAHRYRIDLRCQRVVGLSIGMDYLRLNIHVLNKETLKNEFSSTYLSYGNAISSSATTRCWMRGILQNENNMFALRSFFLPSCLEQMQSASRSLTRPTDRFPISTSLALLRFRSRPPLSHTPSLSLSPIARSHASYPPSLSL